MKSDEPAVWFPTVLTGTGTDVFTQTLVAQLQARGLRADITWLPLRAEYAPWTVPVPKPPSWAAIAHVNTWLHPRFLPRRLPVVATLHHAVHHPDLRVYKGAARATYHRFWIAPGERRVMRRADRVVAVSEFVANTAKQTLIDVPIDVIHNGVDTDRFQPGNRQRQPGEPFRLLYTGSWSARKGVDLLAPIMRELGDAFELCYTGGPQAGTNMSRNTRDIGRLAGTGAVIAELQRADALLFPSRSEGLPLSVIEAMACGLPVIATDGHSLPETILNDETGMLCAPENVQHFAAAARKLASDDSKYRAMSYAARQRAQSMFSRDALLAGYLAVYRG